MSKIRIESLDVLRSIEKLRAREGERMSVCCEELKEGEGE